MSKCVESSCEGASVENGREAISMSQARVRIADGWITAVKIDFTKDGLLLCAQSEKFGPTSAQFTVTQINTGPNLWPSLIQLTEAMLYFSNC